MSRKINAQSVRFLTLWAPRRELGVCMWEGVELPHLVAEGRLWALGTSSTLVYLVALTIAGIAAACGWCEAWVSLCLPGGALSLPPWGSS